MKELIRQITPPLIFSLSRAIFRKRTNPLDEWNVFEGSFNSWSDAEKKSSGYEGQQILEKVRAATLQVKKGEAAFERDSVVFMQMEYNWPLLANLLRIALQFENRLSVIDFGGALGSSYFQSREFLSKIGSLKWKVVEQENFVNLGNKEIADQTLSFYKTIKEAAFAGSPNVMLLSNVLQYLPKPWELLAEIKGLKCPYLVFDSTAFIDSATRLTVQHVPESIYKASYPAWFFNEQEFISKLSEQYQVMCHFDSFIAAPLLVGGSRAYWRGFVFKLKEQ